MFLASLESNGVNLTPFLPVEILGAASIVENGGKDGKNIALMNVAENLHDFLR